MKFTKNPQFLMKCFMLIISFFKCLLLKVHPLHFSLSEFSGSDQDFSV